MESRRRGKQEARSRKKEAGNQESKALERKWKAGNASIVL